MPRRILDSIRGIPRPMDPGAAAQPARRSDVELLRAAGLALALRLALLIVGIGVGAGLGLWFSTHHSEQARAALLNRLCRSLQEQARIDAARTRVIAARDHRTAQLLNDPRASERTRALAREFRRTAILNGRYAVRQTAFATLDCKRLPPVQKPLSPRRNP